MEGGGVAGGLADGVIGARGFDVGVAVAAKHGAPKLGRCVLAAALVAVTGDVIAVGAGTYVENLTE